MRYKNFTNKLKDEIRERDNCSCQVCGKTQEDLDYKLDVHHIDYNRKNSTPENLVAVCRSCHTKIDFDTQKWLKYFSEKSLKRKNN